MTSRASLRTARFAVSAVALAACHDAVTAPAGVAPSDTVSSAPSALKVPTGVNRAIAATTVAPALPKVTVPSTIPGFTRTIHLPAGANLQTALDTAKGGDRIALAPGATYTGNFVLRAKPTASSTKWITIETDSAIMPVGVRARAFRFGRLARIVTPNGNPAIQVDVSAAYYRLQQVEVTTAPNVPTLVTLLNVGWGGAPQTSLAVVPHDIAIDRAYVHGNGTLDLRRCIALHGKNVIVSNSHLEDCHSRNGDAQAIFGSNGPGPFRIFNNYLEGSAENIMFGGADPAIQGLVPSDIRIEHNWLYKPQSWRSDGWIIKNLLELKSAQRVLIEGNIIESCWVAAQSCFALLLKSSNDGNATWTVVQDVTVRYNLIRNGIGGVALAAMPAHPAIPAGRIRIENNLFQDLGAYNGTSGGRMLMLMTPLHDVAFVHNTMIPNVTNGTALLFDGNAGTKNSQVTITDNIFVKPSGGFAMSGNGYGQGIVGLDYWNAQYTFNRNLLVGFDLTLYPAGNAGVSQLSDIGFVDVLSQDYRLSPLSPFLGLTTALTPGADIASITTKTAGADLR